MRLFAVCAPGLEPFTSQEIGQLGLSAHHPGNDSTCEIGGLEFEGNLIDLYRCNLHLRTASRVLVRLGSFYAAGFPELRRKAGNLLWEQYLKPGQPVAVRVTCHQSRLYHQRAVAERIVGSISDRLKQPVQVHKYHEEPETNSSIDNPPSPPFSKRLCRKLVHGSTSSPRKDIDTLNLNYLAVRPERVEGRTANYDTVFKGGTGGSLIVVRMVKDLCTISIDSSGELLHRRGYRLALTKAPLRETLAAAMILASGWDRTSPLLDPFCGSGTIPIEAALMARQIPPGWRRNFDFMNWPNFEKKTWDTMLQGTNPRPQTHFPKIIGSDRDAGAIRAAQENALRAGFSDCVEFSCRAVSSIDPPSGKGWVVTNPPYGARTESNRDLRNLYAQFGKVLRNKCPGWQMTMLCSSSQLLHNTGFQFDEGISLTNGGIRVKLVRGTIK